MWPNKNARSKCTYILWIYNENSSLKSYFFVVCVYSYYRAAPPPRPGAAPGQGGPGAPGAPGGAPVPAQPNKRLQQTQAQVDEVGFRWSFLSPIFVIKNKIFRGRSLRHSARIQVHSRKRNLAGIHGYVVHSLLGESPKRVDSRILLELLSLIFIANIFSFFSILFSPSKTRYSLQTLLARILESRLTLVLD